MPDWKGIVLAGGTGSRLSPLTIATNKHLLPIWDKPMLYYPLSTLMLAGIRDIIVISTPDAIGAMQKLLGNGEQWGIKLTFLEQAEANGIAECFLIARDHIANSNVTLVLGDNIFYGSGLPAAMAKAAEQASGATIFGYPVANPNAFGVVELDDDGAPVRLIEKPEHTNSNLVIPGLYFYDTEIVSIAENLAPSARGEYEITDVNREYLARGQLQVRKLGRGIAWLDGGTPHDMFEAGQFIKVLEERTGLKIGCVEEIAYRQHFIDREQFRVLAEGHTRSAYRDYLLSVIRD